MNVNNSLANFMADFLNPKKTQKTAGNFESFLQTAETALTKNSVPAQMYENMDNFVKNDPGISWDDIPEVDLHAPSWRPKVNQLHKRMPKAGEPMTYTQLHERLSKYAVTKNKATLAVAVDISLDSSLREHGFNTVQCMDKSFAEKLDDNEAVKNSFYTRLAQYDAGAEYIRKNNIEYKTVKLGDVPIVAVDDPDLPDMYRGTWVFS